MTLYLIGSLILPSVLMMIPVVAADPILLKASNEESHDLPRKLQVPPWKQDCRDECKGFVDDFYRDPCFKECNEAFSTHPERKECKNECRLTKKENYRKCQRGYCLDDPAMYPVPYTADEEELCSLCPCCASSPEFKLAVLRPKICFYDNYEFCDSTDSFCEWGTEYDSFSCDGEKAILRKRDCYGCDYREECIGGGMNIEITFTPGAYAACEALLEETCFEELYFPTYDFNVCAE